MSKLINKYIYKGRKVGLRPLELEDLEGGYVSWFNDSEVIAYSSHIASTNPKSKFESYINSLNNDRSKIVWAIDCLITQKHIGNISLQSIDYINRHAELAILIGEKSIWGQGYAKNSCLLALEHGFYRLNLERIYCATAELNMGMQKLAESIKMVKEGVSRKHLYINGEYVDLVRYGILKTEYNPA